MATKYVTLKDSNGDTLYPQAVATNLAPGSIDTTELADGAVTDVKLATPHWKVVSVVEGTNAWNIPAGYRYYRVCMACSAGTPSSGTPAAYISCDGKTTTAWSSGIYNEWSSTSGFQASWDTTTNRVMYASTTAISGSGLTLRSQIELNRNTLSGNYYEGYCITSGSGADWTVQGKIEFAASGSFNLYYERSGCTLSNFHGYVEALVE